jgi:trk system potassium uptake protein TrkH
VDGGDNRNHEDRDHVRDLDHRVDRRPAVSLYGSPTVSLMTTNGYASADFNDWTFLTAMVLVAPMFLSASAGSTSGSIKLVRHVLIGRMLRRELDQTIHSELVTPIRLNGAIVDERGSAP